MKCLFNPGQCFADGVDSLLSLFPFGAYGVVFIAALIIGAVLGKWGVAALIAAIVAVKVGSSRRNDEFTGEVDGPDAEMPKREPLFRRKPRPRTAKRTPAKPHMPPESLSK